VEETDVRGLVAWI